MIAGSTTWHILGAGSIGCLFAAYLRRAEHDVRLILRDDAGVELLQRHKGIELQRNEHRNLIPIAASTTTQLPVPIHNLLICTKAQQTLAAMQSIKSKLDAQPLIVLLQNGMGVRELLMHEIPGATILHAITTEGAYQPTRFHIVHAGIGTTVVGAAIDSEQRFADVTVQSFQCELTINAVPHILEHLWRKLAVNCIINPLTALHECRNGDLFKLPASERHVVALCEEFARVANAEQQPLSAQQIYAEVVRVTQTTSMNRSSMLQDMQAQRRSEIDFINGYLLTIAARHGIDCPQQQQLFDAIKAREIQLGCR